eukprot:122988-Pleurochrysis_carterae.AAC.1
MQSHGISCCQYGSQWPLRVSLVLHAAWPVATFKERSLYLHHLGHMQLLLSKLTLGQLCFSSGIAIFVLHLSRVARMQLRAVDTVLLCERGSISHTSTPTLKLLRTGCCRPNLSLLAVYACVWTVILTLRSTIAVISFYLLADAPS